MFYLKLKYWYWRLFSIFMFLNALAVTADAQIVESIGLYLMVASLVSGIASGAAGVVGGIQAGKAQEAQLAYNKEQDRWNRNRTKRIDSQNFRQALFNNKISLRQVALAESSAAFQRKRSILFDTPKILDWFDGRQERKRAKRLRRAVGEFGIIPVSPASGGQAS